MKSLEDEVIRCFKEEIVIIANRPIPDGMAYSYHGARFEIHRLRYAALGEHDCYLYEQAILALCQEEDRERSLVGLLLCGELVDYNLASPDWQKRAGSVIESLIKEHGLSIEEPTSRYLIIAARRFEVKSAIPAMRHYVQEVTERFKSGGMEPRDWDSAIDPAIRGLVYMAPEMAWEELKQFLSDPRLHELLKEWVPSVLKTWAFYGIEKYGLRGGQRFIKIMKAAPPEIRHWGIDTIKESLDTLEHWSDVMLPSPEERNELLELARRELGSDRQS